MSEYSEAIRRGEYTLDQIANVVDGLDNRINQLCETVGRIRTENALSQVWREAAAESSCRREHGGKWEDFDKFCHKKAEELDSK